jgi:hypothetical protein
MAIRCRPDSAWADCCALAADADGADDAGRGFSGVFGFAETDPACISTAKVNARGSAFIKERC